MVRAAMADGKLGAAAGLGVLEKAMGLLNIVSARRAPMTFSELLRASALPKATLHRILGTLVREGLLRHDPTTRTFQLGFRLLELAHEVWSDFDLRVAAQDELVRLRDAVGESVHLAVLAGQHMVVVASEQAARAALVVSEVGERLPVHASAAGKAVAAHLDPARQAALLDAADLPAFTPRTLASAAALRGDLDLTRTRGYALEDGERDPDTFALAAPIFDYEGQPIGAIAVAGTGEKLRAPRVHALAPIVIAAARAISHNAGGTAMSIAPKPGAGAPATVDVRCASEARALLGEGPVWSPRDDALYWVDILAPAVHWLARDGTEHEARLGAMTSVAVPKASGGLLVATPSGLMGLDLAGRQMTPFAHPESGRAGHRYNDGKCDRRGRLWIASMDMAAAPNRGSLFRVDADGSWRKMDGGFTVPNGLGFSPDGTRMYFTDTFRRTIYAYDFDLAAGTIAGRRPWLALAESDGKPDGLTVDEDGCVWVALWDAWAVARFDPDGREMQRIRVPVPRPTSCCFGDADLGTLYVTTASVRLGEDVLAGAPLSGALLALRIPGVRGLPETIFAG